MIGNAGLRIQIKYDSHTSSSVVWLTRSKAQVYMDETCLTKVKTLEACRQLKY